MPKYQITSPEDEKFIVDAPEGATENEVMAYFHENYKQGKGLGSNPPVEDPELSWPEVAAQGAANFPRSALEVGKGALNAVLNPIDTTQGLLNLGNSALQKTLPDGVNDFMHSISPDTANNEGMADDVGQYYTDRYGGENELKETISNDSAGVMADISAILGIGGGMANAAKLGKTGSALVKAGNIIDPITGSLKLSRKIVPAVGKTAAHILRNSTGTSAEAFKTAAKAGMAGGDKAEDFLGGLRGDTPIKNVIDDFKHSLKKVRKNRSKNYTAGMEDVKGDPTVLDFKPITKEMNNAFDIDTFKGESLSRSTEGVKATLANQIDSWGNKDPAVYHTPEGLDALKRKIGNTRDGFKHGSPARVIADRTYHAVRDQVDKQAKGYGKVMADYSKASDLIDDVEKSFGLGPKTSPHTAMSKIQSLMRNNANTQYGARLQLADELESVGGLNLPEKVAGQALNSMTPRGLASLGSTGLGAASVATMNPAYLLGLIPQSPKLMGTGAYYAGKGYGLLDNVTGEPLSKIYKALEAQGINPGLLSSGLYEADMLANQ